MPEKNEAEIKINIVVPNEKETIRQEIVSRVEAAIADNYKTKQEKQKRKTCTECGKGFLGQDGASTCGPKCRMRKSRKG